MKVFIVWLKCSAWEESDAEIYNIYASEAGAKKAIEERQADLKKDSMIKWLFWYQEFEVKE